MKFLILTKQDGNKTFLKAKKVLYFTKCESSTGTKLTYIYSKNVSEKVLETPEEIYYLLTGERILPEKNIETEETSFSKAFQMMNKM